MDDNRNTSITLFVLMGVAFLFIVIYVFVVVPKKNANTLGSSDLVLNSPIQKWNLRYAQGGIKPFCLEGNEWLGIEVLEASNVYSSSEGIVSKVEKNIVTIEVTPTLYVEYSPIINSKLSKGNYISKGEDIGNVVGSFLNLRVRNTKRGVYECPYFYFNDFTKEILKNVEDVVEQEVKMCECNAFNY